MLVPDDDLAPPGPPVDRFDLEIVEFMLSWAPYGGPPTEECVPLFGMSSERLLARFREIVHTRERRHLAEPELATLQRAAALLDGRSGDTDIDIDGDADDACDLESAPPRRWVLRQGVWYWR